MKKYSSFLIEIFIPFYILILLIILYAFCNNNLSNYNLLFILAIIITIFIMLYQYIKLAKYKYHILFLNFDSQELIIPDKKDKIYIPFEKIKKIEKRKITFFFRGSLSVLSIYCDDVLYNVCISAYANFSKDIKEYTNIKLINADTQAFL